MNTISCQGNDKQHQQWSILKQIMASIPAIKALLERYEFVDSLSLLNSVSDAHIRSLRGEIKEWQSFMNALGLSEKEIRYIDFSEQQQTMKRHSALRKWKKKIGLNASYLSLLKACFKIEDKELAEKILELLNQTNREKSEQQNHRKRTQSKTVFSDGFVDEEDINDLHSQSRTSVSSRGSTESDLLSSKERVAWIKTKYKCMIKAVSEHFQQKMTPEQLVGKLDSFPSELGKLPLCVQLKNTDNAEKFWELIENSDYRHLQIMEHLVNDLGDKLCRDFLATYKQSLIEFLTETTLEEYAAESLSKSGPKESEIVLKLSDQWETRTLQDLDDFVLKLQRKAHFNKYTLLVSKVETGCLEVTLELTADSADINRMNTVDAEFYRRNNILSVLVGDNIIYDVESPKHFEVISVIPPYYYCPIAKEIMLEPVKMLCCGKHSSMTAIQHCLTNEKPCPFCMSNSIKFKVDLSLKEKIKSVRISCPHKQEGCHWMGEIRHLAKHLIEESKNSCKYGIIDCPSSCGKKVQRHSTKKHLQQCSIYNRLLECKYCGSKFSPASTHLDSCFKFPVHCPYNCGTQVERGEVMSHLKKCPKLQTKSSLQQKEQTYNKEEILEKENITEGFSRATEAGYTNVAHNDDTEIPDAGSKLINIAKNLLRVRSELPDIQTELLQVKIQLVRIQMEGVKGQSVNSELEQELKEKELGLQERVDKIKEEVQQLRKEQYNTYKDTLE